MHTEDWDSVPDSGEIAALPTIGALRLIALNVPTALARRRAPRRRMVAGIRIERRRAERRHAIPGIDGLLRMVLADDWK